MRKLQLRFGGYSDPGPKDENQDAFTAYLPEQHSARKFKGGIACIADGVSNSRNAKMASETAVTNFAVDYFSTPDYWSVKQSAQKVISAINSWLYHQGRQSHVREDGYVTTFSALIVKSHTLHILHAGDSRIYRLRDGVLEQITRDHHFYQRTQSSLTRALGFDPTLELDYHSLKAQEGDRYLLSTDGLHETLRERDLTRLLLNTAQDEDLERVAKHLVKTALQQGSDDNTSALLVDITGLPVERLEETITNVAQLAIPPELKEGNKIDHFEIARVLHSSTRSHVYLARDTQNDKRVVLKIPSTNFTDDENYRESFAREQWIGRKLSHPQIVSIGVPTPNTKFLYHVCDFIEGQTLRQWMLDNPTPDLEQVRDILKQMIRPVRALQRNNMVHRDLKPDNFMIDRDGRIILIDLGTVKIAGLDEINIGVTNDRPEGDMHYIAPEILIEAQSTWRSDLFSLGSIAYEMLCGATPFDCIKSNRDYPTRYETWKYRPINTRTQRNDIPKWVDSVLRKCLDARPAKRFNAFSEFETELSKPSASTLAENVSRPLLEKDPLLTWKLLAATLALTNLLSLYFISTK